MQLPTNSLVLVADGEKMLFLRNEGDATYPDLVVEQHREQDNPRTGEQGTDRPGRSFSSVGWGRSAYQEPDYHRLNQDQFAAEAAELLKRRALADDYKILFVIAPPRTLGELRKHYHKSVAERLRCEIGRDLTGHPVADIQKAIADA
ncbi:host attachment protein [Sphingomonas sp. CL5.1]|uniref:host attachment family protein n=1 Tax=Sphingomonas sp. CL5.1 TaxID=2653203 RepID=UPI0015819AEF|nr:host attachment family protein [Sphingomonas sp. CL5.1]QKR99556.1 host attachment protein [Sphingomonas sp. CL5.1]